MTMKEASKVVDVSTPGEADRERSRQRMAIREKEQVWKKDAARKAWHEMSRRDRIVVRST